MASALKNLSEYNEASIPNGKKIKVGIVVADWNKHITHNLYEGCFDTLIKHGVLEENIKTIQVPGAFELNYGGQLLAEKANVDCVIALGCVIKGETTHNEYINTAVSDGLTKMSMVYKIPMIFGLLTPNTEQQAIDRAGGQYGNKGVEAAVTALRMTALKEMKFDKGSTIGFNN